MNIFFKKNKIKGDTHNTAVQNQIPWESIPKNEIDNYILVTGKNKKKYGIRKVKATGTRPTTSTTTTVTTKRTPPKCTLNPNVIKAAKFAWVMASGMSSGRRPDQNGELRKKKRNALLENEYQFRDYGNRIH